MKEVLKKVSSCWLHTSPLGNCNCDEYRNGASPSDPVSCRKWENRWLCYPLLFDQQNPSGYCPADMDAGVRIRGFGFC